MSTTNVTNIGDKATTSAPGEEKPAATEAPRFLTALKEGNVEVVQELTEAASTRSEKDLKVLLSTTKDENGFGPLLIASERGFTDIVEVLLTRNADSSRQDLVDVNQAVLPLIDPNKDNAVLNLVKKLPAGAKALAKIRPIRYTPLLLASKHGHPTTVKILLKFGADVNQNAGTPALRTASGFGQEACVRILLDHGADVHAVQPDTGGTALFSASVNGNVTIGRMLIEKGADVNASSGTNNSSCLFMAVFCKHWSFVELLLQSGADPNRANKIGQTPLAAAVSRNAPTETLDLLLAKGAKATPGLLFSSLFSGPKAAARLWPSRTWRLPTPTALTTAQSTSKID